jgi:hypothetical protein
MTNGQYILGKTLGILSVFLVLNIIILLMGIGFSFLSNVASQSLFAYLTYPLLISLPTLVFILGLSFFIMALVKNQAVTFIILTGYIALTVFYLNKKVYHVFDYIAYQVPMMYSSISGFASFNEILLHRSIYLLLGIGLILLTVYKLRRLPQSPRFSTIPLYLGICFIFAGGFFTYRYIALKKSARVFRQQVVALNNRYMDYTRVTVSTCKLNLEHQGKAITVDALLTINNLNKQSLDTLIFSLNPSLVLQHVASEGNALTFQRDMQIILILLSQPLNPGDSMTIRMQYTGSINENLAFLDRSAEDFDANINFDVFTSRKRYAFLQRNFVCLTSESFWYPIAGTGYATMAPMRYEPDFVRYTLRVKTAPELTAISQGQLTSEGKGMFEFKPEYPLPRISLLIGDYQKYSVKVDSIEYSLFTIKGHDYFKPLFDQISDTIPSLIRDLKKEFEANLGLKYPFHRLILAEVPVHFALDYHIFSYASDAVQPEIILSPEKGVLFSSSDFRNRKYQLEKDLKNNNEEALPEEIQSQMFTQFVRNNFMAKRGQYFNYGDVINWQTYSMFPDYLGFYTQLQSDKWPVISMALEVYMSERFNSPGSTLKRYEDLSPDEKINLKLSNASLEELLMSGIEHDNENDNQLTIRNVAQAKGLNLFNVFRAKLGEKELDTLLFGLIADYPHKPIPFEELNTRFQQRFNINLTGQIQDWYIQRLLPGFLIRNIYSYKVMDGEVAKYQVRFQLSNSENSDGIVTLNVELNDPNRNSGIDFNGYDVQDNLNVDFSKNIFLPARSSFDVGYVFNSEPARMSVVTHISKNLPNNLIYNFSGFNETRSVPLLDEIIQIPFFDFLSERNEIIVDNEDKGFSYEQVVDVAYLKSLINKKQTRQYNYTALNSWRPPREWRAVLRSEFYGKYVHSAYYTKSGSGERTATWKAALPEKTTYDVYFFLDKVNLGWRRTNKTPDYNFTIYHDNGTEIINRSTEEIDLGWNYLGTFFISTDTAKVELSNKTIGDMIFADALKWVINE